MSETKMYFARFTPQGLEQYKQFLLVDSSNTNKLPTWYDQMNDPTIADIIQFGDEASAAPIEVSGTLGTFPTIKTQYDFAKTLYDTFQTQDNRLKILEDPNAMAWISCLYFKRLTKLNNKTGFWDIRESSTLKAHIPEGQQNGFSQFHRHPVYWMSLYETHHKPNSENAKFLLYNDSTIQGEIMEQLATKSSIVINANVVDVARRLYWDTANQKPKDGFSDTKKPYGDGTIRRFSGKNGFVSTHGRVYDFLSMTSDEIFDLLPSEFSTWKK